MSFANFKRVCKNDWVINVLCGGKKRIALRVFAITHFWRLAIFPRILENPRTHQKRDLLVASLYIQTMYIVYFASIPGQIPFISTTRAAESPTERRKNKIKDPPRFLCSSRGLIHCTLPRIIGCAIHCKKTISFSPIHRLPTFIPVYLSPTINSNTSFIGCSLFYAPKVCNRWRFFFFLNFLKLFIQSLRDTSGNQEHIERFKGARL